MPIFPYGRSDNALLGGAIKFQRCSGLMMSRSQETIYALSSGAPPAGVAVIRVSGRAVPPLLEELFGQCPIARVAKLKWIRDRNNEPVDQALVLYFPAPHSFTGEDCVEFHVHGGRAVLQAMLRLLKDHGLRHAEAGEFSRRAFENNKLDLVEIEGLSDLITAETEMQRRLAMTQSSGQLSDLYQSWMRQLTKARALIEAELDFPEEDDVPGAVGDRAWEEVAHLAEAIKGHLNGRRSAELIRDGFNVVIAGPPNAGKSSLLNALVKREAAIVTAIAGTTRDVISVDLDLGGYLVHLLDTAGLRQTEDVIEAEGIRRAHQVLEDADLVLLLKDADDTGEYQQFVVNAEVVRVRSKIDRIADLSPEVGVYNISSSTGAGIDSLTKRIFEVVSGLVTKSGTALVVRQRQADLLSETFDLLVSGCQDAALDLEIRSEYLRLASHCLGKLTGFVDVEGLLDVIFSEFCIGK